jgi:basic amino acid/polyamine antiporter, APA family
VPRDGLLPASLAAVHPKYETPVNAQLLCGAIAMVLAAFFNVHLLAKLLDIGVIVGYGQ